MKHFTPEQWADFARGLVGKKDKSLMQNHLEECKECEKEASLWWRVVQTARHQTTVEPSEGAVRYAKAIFAANRPSEQARESFAQLLFDSMKTPALAGVRSATTGPRQMLFGLGDHRIDLRMEPQIDTDNVMIIGQVLDAANPGRVFRNVPISLHLGDKLVATSQTNEFGEFELECRLAGRLQLSATLPQGQRISLALVEPAAPALDSSSYHSDPKGQKGFKAGGSGTKGKM